MKTSDYMTDKVPNKHVVAHMLLLTQASRVWPIFLKCQQAVAQSSTDGICRANFYYLVPDRHPDINVTTYLVCKFGGAHDFYDIECSPAYIVAQHLQL